ncbi:MAG: hypothetical protein LC721_00440 [Actinobacteria bacterium]|nr:hypothetical protein [Actinomycetota bacterium]
MASDSWLCLGGMEIVNSCRVGAYAANGWRALGSQVKGCGCCGPQMAQALEENFAAYTDPATDGAPWYSTSEPNSGDFGGFMVLSITGLGAGPTTRDVTQRANGRGSIIGPAIQASPQIVVTGMLIGKTCCSVEYGLRWLGTVLQGSCDSDCDGDELTFLDCCPDFTQCATGGVTPADCLEPHLRFLRGVQLLSSPAITQRFGSCCGRCEGASMLQVQFTLGASSPCVYREPVVVGTQQAFDLSTADDCAVTWVLVQDGEECPTDPGCVDPPDCLADPTCIGLPAPPSPPAPTNPCICFPMTTVRTCIDIPAGSIPEFTEGLPVLTVHSGSQEMRQIRAKFWVNDQGQPVDQLDPCNACGEVSLSRIPAGSTFVFDGQTREATITCPGSSPTDATTLMGSTGGTLPVAWPEIACASTRFTVCVEADGDTVAADAWVSLSVVASECY